MTTKSKECTYQYNDLGDNHIRLLHLLGAQSEKDQLQAELVTYTLPTESSIESEPGDGLEIGSDGSVAGDSVQVAPWYHALSYTWGSSFSEARRRSPQRDKSRSKDKSMETQEQAIVDIVQVSKKGRRTSLGHLSITKNLETALLAFRAELEPEEELLLWVDALCINQCDTANDTEMAHQLQRMGEIYSQAQAVRVWLGESGEDSTTACEFISEILALENLDSYCTDQSFITQWLAFRNLMQRSWFKRRWIVQEIAFARDAEVYCGADKVSWLQLSSAVTLFARKKDALRAIFQNSPELGHEPDYLGEVDAYGAKNLIDTIGRMFRRTTDNEVLEELLPLESVLTSLTAFEAARPHDYLYAVMRLSSDARPVAAMSRSRSRFRSGSVHSPVPDITINGQVTPDSEAAIDERRGRPLHRRQGSGTHLSTQQAERSRSRGRSPMRAKEDAEREYRQPKQEFVVDYSNSMFSLCTNIVDFIVERSNSIDIICKPWAPNMTPSPDSKWKVHDEDRFDMPSWIQLLDKRPFEAKTDGRTYIRIAPDPLVGTQLYGLKPYNECGAITAFGKSQSPKLTSGRILSVKGFVLDRINKRQRAAGDGLIPAGWLKLIEWDVDSVDAKLATKGAAKGSGLQPPPEKFWRTLVGNRASSSSPQLPPEDWRYVCRRIFTERPENGSVDTAELLRKQIPNTGHFLHRLRAVTWNRSLIMTAGLDDDSPGFLGLAPSEADTGDLICILHGCSVPVVLRAKKRRPNREQPLTSDRRGSRGPKRKRTYSGDPYEHDPRPTLPRSAAIPEVAIIDDHEEEFSLIGECYIHGMMDGEAFREKERHSIQLREFRIGCTVDCNCERCDPRNRHGRSA